MTFSELLGMFVLNDKKTPDLRTSTSFHNIDTKISSNFTLKTYLMKYFLNFCEYLQKKKSKA